MSREAAVGQGRVRKLCPPYSSQFSPYLEISPFSASPVLNGARASPSLGNIAGEFEVI